MPLRICIRSLTRSRRQPAGWTTLLQEPFSTHMAAALRAAAAWQSVQNAAGPQQRSLVQPPARSTGRRRAWRAQGPARASPAPDSSAVGIDDVQLMMSEAEKFVPEMSEAEAAAAAAAPPPVGTQQLEAQLVELQQQIRELGAQIDALYSGVFVGVELPAAAEDDSAAAALASELAAALPDPSALSEAAFGELGRTSPKVGRRCCRA